MKFKLDENLPREASALFRKAGHDALTVADQRLSGADDAALYDVRGQERRFGSGFR